MTATITLGFTACVTRLDDLNVAAGLRAAHNILGSDAAAAHHHAMERAAGRDYDPGLVDLWDVAQWAAILEACATWKNIPRDVALFAQAVGQV